MSILFGDIMENKFKLGIIGAGNMATAILQGILKGEVLSPEQIAISDVQDGKRDFFTSLGVHFTTDNAMLASSSEYVLFAVKPQIAPEVFDEIAKFINAKNVISIMAGVSINKLKSALGDRNYARIMPNMPATVGEGMSAIAFSGKQDEFVLNVFKAVGNVIIIDENLFDAVTSLSGSGPAYVYMFIEALIRGGMDGGLDKQTATTLALQTITGAVKMVENSTKPIGEMVDAVCSKGGTTIQAVEHYRNNNLEQIVIDGMIKCRNRSAELAGNKIQEITVYTDGACSGNPGVGGWSAIVINENGTRKLSGAERETTNNRMELQGIIEGLKAVEGSQKKVSVYSDSAYAINSINEGWIYGWQLNGWRTSSKEEVKNVDLWLELLDLMQKHKVTFVKVKGHANNELNNECDSLAKNAIKELQKKLTTLPL